MPDTPVGLSTSNPSLTGNYAKLAWSSFVPRWLKFVVTLVLLTVLLAQVDWQDALAVASSIPSWAIVVALALILTHFPINAWKWQASLRIHGIRQYRNGYLMKVAIAGFFFNNFLPSAIGGDAFRVAKTIPSRERLAEAVSAVLLDRITGLSALMVLGSIGAILLYRDFAFALTFLAIGFAGAGVVVIAAVAIYFGVMKRVTNLLRKMTWFEHLDRIHLLLRHPRKEWLPLILWSLVFQGSSVAIIYVLMQGLGIDATIAMCALISASAGLVTVLPISINGYGVVEGSIAGSGVALGLPYDELIVAAVIYRLLVLPVSLSCGLVFLFSRQELGELPSLRNTT